VPLHFTKPRCEQSIQLAALVVAVGLMITAGDVAGAAGGRSERSVVSVEPRAAGQPIMAIVSLRRQQITIYDAQGWILRAPVSSGQSGRETPAGIFSVIQKEAEHHSNLYDDAFMPHMQRLTWSGIALHGGVVPGHPASHGCIRTKKANEARIAVFKASREAAQAMVPVRVAENLKLRAEAQLDVAERELASASSAEAKEQAEDARKKAAALAVELSAQLAVARAAVQPKVDAVVPAREALLAAEAVRAAADEEARKTARDLEPISIFISRRTQHLYVRRGFASIFDAPVTIREADRTIGTHVFTATAHARGELNMRWSVVSLVGGGHSDVGLRDSHDLARGDRRGNEASPSGDLASAREALDRVSIPQDTVDRIDETISPRSSLIISDEPLSSETGQGTEFVVLLSGEPQGGIKNRRRGPEVEVRYRRPGGSTYWGSRFAGPYFAR
jgi:L,D-transpeptidase catalytic domain